MRREKCVHAHDNRINSSLSWAGGSSRGRMLLSLIVQLASERERPQRLFAHVMCRTLCLEICRIHFSESMSLRRDAIQAMRGALRKPLGIGHTRTATLIPDYLGPLPKQRAQGTTPLSPIFASWYCFVYKPLHGLQVPPPKAKCFTPNIHR